MLTAARNDILTRVGPGTPMGTLLRRYWMPIAGASEFTARNADQAGAPARRGSDALQGRRRRLRTARVAGAAHRRLHAPDRGRQGRQAEDAVQTAGQSRRRQLVRQQDEGRLRRLRPRHRPIRKCARRLRRSPPIRCGKLDRVLCDANGRCGSTPEGRCGSRSTFAQRLQRRSSSSTVPSTGYKCAAARSTPCTSMDRGVACYFRTRLPRVIKDYDEFDHGFVYAARLTNRGAAYRRLVIRTGRSPTRARPIKIDLGMHFEWRPVR